MERIDIANLLMMLSRSSGQGDIRSQVYECKTCNRQFPSFQALGGHRASHKRPRLLDDGGDEAKLGVLAKFKVHQCSICGLQFAVGQALGGHMRRHRVELFGRGLTKEKKRTIERKRVPRLDLNLPPIQEGLDQIEDLHSQDLKYLDNKISKVGSFL